MRLGAHQSVSGGLHKAFDRAEEDRCEAIQVFTKNKGAWRDPPMDETRVRVFRERRQSSPCARTPLLAHASYLINLASPKDEVQLRSRASLLEEVRRCTLLGIERVVVHPGAFLDGTVELGIRAVIDALQWVLSSSPDSNVQLLVENTAGQGTYLGGPLEQVGEILAGVDRAVPGREPRIGMCLDTCHAFVFGYELRTPRGFSAMWRSLDASVGVDRVLAVHLNDTTADHGSHRDRHARVGTGQLGMYPFWRLVNEKRLRDVPAVLETPPDGDDRAFRGQLVELRALRGIGAKAIRP